MEQPHSLYQADYSEEDGECGTYSIYELHRKKDIIIVVNITTGTTHEHYDSSNPLNLDEDELERVKFIDTVHIDNSN